MLKKITLSLVALIILLLAYASTRPDTFRVERSVVIKAAPEKIFPLINNFKQWQNWSPWAKMDPAMKSTYSGQAVGAGAVYQWVGNDKVGAGSMEITGSTSPSKVVVKLDFIQPFEGHNTAEFTLTPAGDSTKVAWAMFGPAPFVSKVMGLFFSMDAMIGKDFEAGLDSMKGLAEK